MSTAVGIVGAGDFGRALAHAAVRAGNAVRIQSRREVELPEGAEVVSKIEALSDCEPIFLAVPSAYVAKICDRLCGTLDGRQYLVHVSRGLVGDELRTLSSVLMSSTPCRRVGALAGPLVARALVDGEPGGCIVGTRFPEVADAVRSAIGGDTMRVYDTADVVGVEVASAMVGLLALTAGLAGGDDLPPATLAVLAARGVAEATRLGRALGAEAETFAGLAGLGDLVAAFVAGDRPESRLGRALFDGRSVEEAIASTESGHVEGLGLARRIASFAERRGGEAPIAAAVADVLEGRCTAKQAMGKLMARRTGAERGRQ